MTEGLGLAEDAGIALDDARARSSDRRRTGTTNVPWHLRARRRPSPGRCWRTRREEEGASASPSAIAGQAGHVNYGVIPEAGVYTWPEVA